MKQGTTLLYFTIMKNHTFYNKLKIMKIIKWKNKK